MKTYLTLIFAIGLLTLNNLLAQCPSANIVLTTQSQIDSFPIVYPNCTELIQNLWIGGNSEETNTDITDLSALNQITFVGNYLFIQFTENLTSLAGLENLTSVDRVVSILDNTSLTDISGLSNLTSVDGIRISRNSSLENLDGLAGVTSLPDFGSIGIFENDILTDISGLENIPPTDIESILIMDNPNLSDCSIDNFCSYLAEGGYAQISGNTGNCTFADVFFDTCPFEVYCPIEDVYLTTQSQIDSFSINYPNCTQLIGNLSIGGTSNDVNSDITNLDALNQITDIRGNISIRYTDNLISIEGLQGLNSTDKIYINNNNSLVSLNGLENIDSLKTNLYIEENSSLNDISSIENISFDTDASVYITDNPSLSTCDLQSICTYMGSGGFIVIDNNAPGCDNDVEIAQSCGISIQCPLGNISLKSQEDIDAFPILYPDCTELEHRLDVREGGFINTPISDLSPLNQITKVGNLYIQSNPELTDLTGLDNLTTVRSVLNIGENPSLFNLNLSSLTSVGVDMWISNNSSLINLNGLDSLNSVGGHLLIWGNDNMINLNGLEGLTYIGGLIWINGNNALESLNGIENINSDEIGTLQIQNNPNLSVCSMENICHFIAEGGFTIISDNLEGCNTAEEILQNCTPFWAYAIEGNISMDINEDCLKDSTDINLNGWLVKVEGEQSINYAYTYDGGNYVAPADTGTFIVTPIPPNSLWEDICFESDIAVLTPLSTRDTLNFSASTSTFCPFLEVDITTPILRRCFNSQYYVRYCNAGTAAAENVYVEVQLDPYFTFVNATIEEVDLSDNLYSFNLGNVGVGECNDFQIEVYVNCDTVEIGQTHCVEAHIFPDSICTPTNPSWDESSIMVNAQCLGDSIEFIIENVGTGDMSDSLEYLVIEENLIFQQANFKLNSSESKVFYKEANGLFHRLEAEQSPGHPGNSMPSVFVEGCGEGDNGEISVGYVNYYLLDEGDAFVSIDCQENVGAYDPNDKQAFPVGYGAPHYITDSTDLEYMIRFQNTGTDTAFTVVIRDTISPHLNIETLMPGVASHDYRYDIDSSNIAVFHFENIMLPDSNANEAASHGFIKFDIKQQRNNPIGTLIENNAGIYFDFNEPIITNTVFHTIGEDFMGIVTSVITPPEVSDAGVSVNVFPNPFDEYTRFEVQGEAVKELHLNLYDMMGREVLQQQSTHQQHITLYKNKLPSGVYVFRLMDEKQQLATGKLIVK